MLGIRGLEKLRNSFGSSEAAFCVAACAFCKLDSVICYGLRDGALNKYLASECGGGTVMRLNPSAAENFCVSRARRARRFK